MTGKPAFFEMFQASLLLCTKNIQDQWEYLNIEVPAIECDEISEILSLGQKI